MNLNLVHSEEKYAGIYSIQEKMVAHFVKAQNEREHIELINNQFIDHLSLFDTTTHKLIGHIILNVASSTEIELRRIVIYQRSKGYGKSAINLLLKYIFAGYPACKLIWLDVYSSNKVAQNLYLWAGFKMKFEKDDLLIYHYSVA